MKNIIKKEDDQKERLDMFLTEKTGKTRSQIKNLINGGGYLVNGVKVTPHFIVRLGDEIEEVEIIEVIEELKKTNKTNRSLFNKIKIIDDTPEFLIVNKPSGILSHGSDHLTELTLVDFLLEKYPKLAKVGDDPQRPAIVHRLDREASGLMVIPKTQESFDNIKTQFKKRTIKKQYQALVYGQIIKDESTINFPIKRSTEGNKMAAIPATEKGEVTEVGKKAVTEFKVLKRFINYTLVSVIIKTGRTHQIRVHLSAYGYPLVGDDVYSTRKTKDKNKKLKLGRIFLVAVNLQFKDLKGELKSYEIKLPNELIRFLEEKIK